MQWPGLPIGIDPVPVVQPEGDVARLLNLGNDQAGADGMNGSGRDENAIAGSRLECVQQFLATPGFDRFGEALPVDPLLKACVDSASLLSLDDVPGLRFAAVGWRSSGGRLIVRMDLYRENLVGIKKLEKQRKRCWLAAATKQFSWMLAEQITEALPGQGASPDHALVLATINQRRETLFISRSIRTRVAGSTWNRNLMHKTQSTLSVRSGRASASACR